MGTDVGRQGKGIVSGLLGRGDRQEAGLKLEALIQTSNSIQSCSTIRTFLKLRKIQENSRNSASQFPIQGIAFVSLKDQFYDFRIQRVQITSMQTSKVSSDQISNYC